MTKDEALKLVSVVRMALAALENDTCIAAIEARAEILKLVAQPVQPPLPVQPEREWVGLTNDEVNNFAAGCHLGNSVQDAIFRAEAKLKEKNT